MPFPLPCISPWKKFFRLHVYHGDENTKPYELVPVCRLFWDKKGDWWYIFRPDLDVHIRIYKVYLEEVRGVELWIRRKYAVKKEVEGPTKTHGIFVDLRLLLFCSACSTRICR